MSSHIQKVIVILGIFFLNSSFCMEKSELEKCMEAIRISNSATCPTSEELALVLNSPNPYGTIMEYINQTNVEELINTTYSNHQNILHLLATTLPADCYDLYDLEKEYYTAIVETLHTKMGTKSLKTLLRTANSRGQLVTKILTHADASKSAQEMANLFIVNNYTGAKPSAPNYKGQLPIPTYYEPPYSTRAAVKADQYAQEILKRPSPLPPDDQQQQNHAAPLPDPTNPPRNNNSPSFLSQYALPLGSIGGLCCIVFLTYWYLSTSDEEKNNS